MSFSLDLEIDSRADKSHVLDILRDMHFVMYDEGSDGVRGNFPGSNMYVVARWVTEESEMPPRTEDSDFAKNWKIGVRASFYYVIGKQAQCSFEVNDFLSRLNEKSDAFFILSFQMEKIYAIRDESGFRVVEKF